MWGELGSDWYFVMAEGMNRRCPNCTFSYLVRGSKLRLRFTTACCTE